ncbi:MAG: formylglycine-generating enzyme family protein [Thermodesulfobacteriota bacterium]
MPSSLLTLQAVDEALANLNLKDGTLKAELVKAIRARFQNDASLQTLIAIPTDDLILKLWGDGSAEDLKARRKNFSSLKSGLNKSLKDLGRAGNNPAGIIIGRDNVFTVSEERKDDLIRQLGIPADTPNIFQDMLEAFRRFFTETAKDKSIEEIQRMLASLDQAGMEMRQMAGMPLESPPPVPETPIAPLGEGDSAETIELQAGDEIEVVEIPAELESLAEEGEEPPLAEEEEIVEIEESLPPLEEIPAEELESLELPEGEEIPFAEEEEIVEIEVPLPPLEEIPAEELESLELPEGEEIPHVEEEEIVEIEVPLPPLEEIPADEIESLELPEGEEIPFAEEEEIVEVEETLPPLEEIPADELESLELPEGEEIPHAEEEIVEIEEPLPPLEEIPADELETVELPEEEIPLAGEEEIVEVEETLPPLEEIPADELETVELPEGEEIPHAEEEEIVEVEETLPPLEEIPADELETVELPEEEIPLAGEEEIVEVEELAESPPLSADTERSTPPSPLEILSKYIEANEALAEERELLRETQEEFINQILERFMPKFIKIPAGSYQVGSRVPHSLEQPLRQVALPAFYLGQLPVTNDLFDFFVRETGYVTEAEEAGYGVVYEGRCTRRIDPATGRETLNLTSGTMARHVSGANWRHPNGPDSSLEGRHNHPVVQVSHADAMAFAAWAGKRLPGEEEWEAAARGQDGRLFPWGNQWQAERGNFESACLGGTTAVDHFGRQGMGPFGIIDMLGNVAEWTATLYPGSSGTDPVYILKGGSWINSGVVSAAYRQIERGRHWANTIGFRCAVSG